MTIGNSKVKSKGRGHEGYRRGKASMKSEREHTILVWAGGAHQATLQNIHP